MTTPTTPTTSTRSTVGYANSTTSSTNATSNADTTTKVYTTNIKNVQRIYIAPCICYQNKEWVNLTSTAIINILVTNLTIDQSNTTKARAKLISRSDTRASSKYIGRFACAVLAALLGVIVSFDCTRFFTALRDRDMLKRKTTSIVSPIDANNKITYNSDSNVDYDKFIIAQNLLTDVFF